MGAKESTVSEYSQDGLRDFHANFSFLKVENDPRLGKVHLFTEKSSGKHIALFDKSCPDVQRFQKFKSQLQERIAMDHVNILKIVGYVVRKNDNLCGSNEVFTVFVEWYEHDLELEIVERASGTDFFKESEMWYMANSLINACAYMESNNVYHGDIRPINVFMNEEGKIFLADHFFINPMIDNWGKALGKSKDVFLDPSQLNELKNGHESPFYDVYKADAFSLGMTLLYAGILENPIRAYNWKACEIDGAIVDSYLKKFSEIYSPQLTALLASMLEFNELKRPTFTQLQQYMDINMPFYNRGRGSPVKQFPSEANGQYGSLNYQSAAGNYQQNFLPSVPMINSQYVPQNQTVGGRFYN